MAPQGPMLPRKSSQLAKTKASMEVLAYQIGVIIAVERNRSKWTQWDLAEELGIDQVDISDIENGKPARVSDAEVDRLFKTLHLDPKGAQCNFLKLWSKNSTL